MTLITAGRSALPTDLAYMAKAERDYEAASRAVQTAMTDELDARLRLADARANWAHADAALWRDGLLLGDRQPKNEAERDAALTLARAASPEHVELKQRIERHEVRLAAAARALEAARDARSLSKRQIDYAIAALTYLAAGREDS